MDIARKFLLAASLIGVVFFSAFLFMLSSDPARFEARAKNFAVATVQTKAADFAQQRGLQLPSEVDGSALQDALAERLGARSETYARALEANVDEWVADILASRCAMDCGQRDAVRDIANSVLESGLARYGQGATTLRGFAQNRYDTTVRGLHRDLTIMSFSNLVVFLFMIALTLTKPRYMPALVKLGVLAFLSVAVMLAWYVFGQDWIATLIFNAYVGWAYAVFMGILFLSLCDIAFNEARILNGMSNVIGSVSSGC